LSLDEEKINKMKEFYKENIYPNKNEHVSTLIKLDNLTNSLESRFEKNIYFGGELLDISGYCGGYNLSMCLASALIIFTNIIKED
jgi:predicted flavoprotein YhiN